jgi:hypothetical protein
MNDSSEMTPELRNVITQATHDGVAGLRHDADTETGQARDEYLRVLCDVTSTLEDLRAATRRLLQYVRPQ